VKQESEEYPSGSGHTLQITLTSKSVVSPLEEEFDLPEISFDFVPIAKLQELSAKSKAGDF
jgi:hypothetical protein